MNNKRISIYTCLSMANMYNDRIELNKQGIPPFVQTIISCLNKEYFIDKLLVLEGRNKQDVSVLEEVKKTLEKSIKVIESLNDDELIKNNINKNTIYCIKDLLESNNIITFEDNCEIYKEKIIKAQLQLLSHLEDEDLAVDFISGNIQTKECIQTLITFKNNDNRKIFLYTNPIHIDATHKNDNTVFEEIKNDVLLTNNSLYEWHLPTFEQRARKKEDSIECIKNIFVETFRSLIDKNEAESASNLYKQYYQDIVDFNKYTIQMLDRYVSSNQYELKGNIINQNIKEYTRNDIFLFLLNSILSCEYYIETKKEKEKQKVSELIYQILYLLLNYTSDNNPNALNASIQIDNYGNFFCKKDYLLNVFYDSFKKYKKLTIDNGIISDFCLKFDITQNDIRSINKAFNDSHHADNSYNKEYLFDSIKKVFEQVFADELGKLGTILFDNEDLNDNLTIEKLFFSNYKVEIIKELENVQQITKKKKTKNAIFGMLGSTEPYGYKKSKDNNDEKAKLFDGSIKHLIMCLKNNKPGINIKNDPTLYLCITKEIQDLLITYKWTKETLEKVYELKNIVLIPFDTYYQHNFDDYINGKREFDLYNDLIMLDTYDYDSTYKIVDKYVMSILLKEHSLAIVASSGLPIFKIESSMCEFVYPNNIDVYEIKEPLNYRSAITNNVNDKIEVQKPVFVNELSSYDNFPIFAKLNERSLCLKLIDYLANNQYNEIIKMIQNNPALNSVKNILNESISIYDSFENIEKSLSNLFTYSYFGYYVDFASKLTFPCEYLFINYILKNRIRSKDWEAKIHILQNDVYLDGTDFEQSYFDEITNTLSKYQLFKYNYEPELRNGRYSLKNRPFGMYLYVKFVKNNKLTVNEIKELQNANSCWDTCSVLKHKDYNEKQKYISRITQESADDTLKVFNDIYSNNVNIENLINNKLEIIKIFKNKYPLVFKDIKEQPMEKLIIYDVRGIQDFIFRTNKLKEISGASIIVRDILENKIKEFCKANNILFETWCDEKGVKTFSFFDLNKDKEMIEEVYEGGGNLMIATRLKDDLLESLNKYLQESLLKDTYSLSLAYASIEINENSNYLEKYKLIKEKLNDVKKRMPPLYLTKPLPICDICPDTGYPILNGATVESRLKENIFNNAKDGKTTDIDKMFYSKNEKNDSSEKTMIAIVHIDGNDMGGIISSYMDETHNTIHSFKDGVNISRKLSFKIKSVFGTNVNNIMNKYVVRLVINSGDDITFISRSSDAIKISNEIMKMIEDNYLGNNKNNIFTSCCGIAFIHRHFPFSKGYEIAEECCSIAKAKSKINENRYKLNINEKEILRPASYIDYEIIQSGIINTVSNSRSQMNTLSLKPYRVLTNNKPTNVIKEYETIDSLLKICDQFKKASRNAVKQVRNTYEKSEIDTKLLFYRLDSRKNLGITDYNPYVNDDSKIAKYYDASCIFDLLNDKGDEQ